MRAPADRFTPMRRATRARRRLLLLVGPLLWVAALVVVDVVARTGDEVRDGLLVTAVSFGAALAVLVPVRLHRIRTEREP